MRIDTSTGKMPRRPFVIAGLISIVLLWAFNFIAAKIGLRYFPPLALASFRVILAGAVMVPIYLVCSRMPVFSEAAKFRSSGPAGRDLWTFFYLGFLGVTVNQICFTVGLAFTQVIHSAIIVGLGPVYIFALAVLFRLERATWHKALGMAVALSGVAALASENASSSHASSILGDAITITGSIGFAVYVVLGKRVAQKYDALTMTAFNHFAGALIVLPLGIREAAKLSSAGIFGRLPWQAWGALLYMAILASALAYVLYFWLLRYLEASQLAAFSYLLPITATLLGILILGEKASWIQLVGGALALGGVYWIESGREPALKDN